MLRLISSFILILGVLGEEKTDVPSKLQREETGCKFMAGRLLPWADRITFRHVYEGETKGDTKTLTIELPNKEATISKLISSVYIYDAKCNGKIEKASPLSGAITKGGIGRKYVTFKLDIPKNRPYEIHVLVYG